MWHSNSFRMASVSGPRMIVGRSSPVPTLVERPTPAEVMRGKTATCAESFMPLASSEASATRRAILS